LGALDYIVLVAYLAGVCAVGLITSAKVRNSADLFAAGREAPWWVAGLSSYMTMFSAATFVVWGGVAYRYGVVAIVINLMYGIAAMLVGFFVAGRWRELGVMTAAEFVELRFGKSALAVFTVLNLIAKMLSVAVGLYALAVMICALVPLADSQWLQDPATGHLSLKWTVVALGGMVVAFTVAGGLWAVLVTDVVQFVIIMIAVALVTPLMVYRVGGPDGFAAAAPSGFFSLSNGDWSWWILAGWCAIQFTMIGAEWAFVQRYLCVATPRAAKQVAWLFGALYLVTPILWMIPPMIYRTFEPNANPEQAYVLACQSVLPAGAMGLMLAAMAAATLSGIDSQLNVFAGVLTSDFYKPFLRPNAGEVEMVRVGRLLTTALGAALIGLALVAPRWGGAEAFVVKVTSLYVGPLLLPTIWGLFSRRLTSWAMWLTVAASAYFATLAMWMQSWSSGVSDSTWLGQIALWVQQNPRQTDMLIGLVLPALVLAVLEWSATATSPGWIRVANHNPVHIESSSSDAAAFTLRAAGWTLLASGLLLGGLTWFDSSDMIVLVVFSVVLCGMGAASMALANRCGSESAAADDGSTAEAVESGNVSSRAWTGNCALQTPTSD
jgi:Na+/proline symporter